MLLYIFKNVIITSSISLPLIFSKLYLIQNSKKCTPNTLLLKAENAHLKLPLTASVL